MEPDVLVAQAVVAFIVIFALAASALTQDAEYVPPEGTIQVLMLGLFVDRYLPDPGDWASSSKRDTEEIRPTEVSRRLAQFEHQYASLKRDGHISEAEILRPDLRHHPISHFVGAVMIGAAALVFAPIAGFAAFSAGREADRHRSISPIISPIERSYKLTQFAGLFAAVMLWTALSIYYLGGTTRLLVTFALAIPAGALLVAGVRTVRGQRAWKKYWSSRLAQIMQRATFDNDHDLFMRASQLHSSVEREATIPLTDTQRIILLVAAIVQILLIGVVPLAKALWQHNLGILNSAR